MALSWTECDKLPTSASIVIVNSPGWVPVKVRVAEAERVSGESVRIDGSMRVVGPDEVAVRVMFPMKPCSPVAVIVVEPGIVGCNIVDGGVLVMLNWVIGKGAAAKGVHTCEYLVSTFPELGAC